ncbi:MAG: SLBB domain-containing protein, partial [Sphingomonas sp.]
VLGRDDFRARVRVQTDGAIQLPLIGRTEATGRTALQLGEQIRKALRGGGYFANPVVSVDIATYASRYVVVLGEVGQPGLVPVDRSYRVSEILARVGGAKASAADDLTLRRESGEERQLAIVKLATGGREDDPQVNPGDKLYLPAAKTYYIYGQVNAPGNYKLDTSMTLRQAIARGGGLTAAGSEKRARVYRDGKELKKYSLNDLLQPGDTVVVGERFF